MAPPECRSGGFAFLGPIIVLVYASNEADPVHSTARALVERLAAGPDLVHLFWPALLGYLRIVTHARSCRARSPRRTRKGT